MISLVQSKKNAAPPHSTSPEQKWSQKTRILNKIPEIQTKMQVAVRCLCRRALAERSDITEFIPLQANVTSLSGLFANKSEITMFAHNGTAPL